MQKSASASALRTPYLRLVHLEVSSPSAGGVGGLNPFGLQFSPEEEEEFGEMARSEGFYERFAKSVAPSIFGSLGELMKLCLLSSRSSLIKRHKEGYYLSPFRWLEENPT